MFAATPPLSTGLPAQPFFGLPVAPLPWHGRGSLVELFERCISACADGVVILDPNVRDVPVIYINGAAEKITGYLASETLGRGWHVLEGSAPEAAILKKAIRTVEECRVTLREKRKDGVVYWVDITLSPVRDASGKATHFIAVQSDATARYEAAEERAAYQRQLREMSNRLLASEDGERRRIAVGLHDDVGQALVACKLHLQSLFQSIDPHGSEKLAPILALLDHSIRATRTLTFELSPPTLYEMGLASTIQALGDRMSREQRLKVRCDFSTEGRDLPRPTLDLFFRIARELLFNVVKHARAKSAEVKLEQTSEEIILSVSDDGCGFNSEGGTRYGAHAGGFGLFSIRDRLRYLGGELEIFSVAESGTYIRARLPIQEVKAEAPSPSDGMEDRSKS